MFLKEYYRQLKREICSWEGRGLYGDGGPIFRTWEPIKKTWRIFSMSYGLTKLTFSVPEVEDYLRSSLCLLKVIKGVSILL